MFRGLAIMVIQRKAKNPVMLGRWEHRQTHSQTEIKSIWANSDNCGDQICGNPEAIKNITDIKKEPVPEKKKYIHYMIQGFPWK